MNSFFGKIIHRPVYIHLLAMAVVSIITVYITLKYLDLYTNHNQAVFVPDVTGLQVEEAIPFLEQNSLRYTVIDSIYSKEVMPGAIVDLIPEAKSKVKKNRIIYMTINAKTEESVTLPDVTGFSFRLAYATLKSRRFKDVDWQYVSGEFRDLTIGVEYNGNLVESGMRLPINAKLTLIVSNGINRPLESDTIINIKTDNIGSNDSWY